MGANPCERRSSPKIEQTFCFLDGDAFHGVGGDHGGFQIAVTKQLLNRANIDIRLVGDGWQNCGGRYEPWPTCGG